MPLETEERKKVTTLRYMNTAEQIWRWIMFSLGIGKTSARDRTSSIKSADNIGQDFSHKVGINLHIHNWNITDKNVKKST